jgi:hypothetical protein
MSVVRPELTADSHGFSRSPSKRAGQRHSDLSTARTMSGVLVPGPLLLHTISTSVAPYLHQWWLKPHSDWWACTEVEDLSLAEEYAFPGG